MSEKNEVQTPISSVENQIANAGLKWSNKEIAYVLRYYDKIKLKDMAKHLGRTVPAVKHKMRDLELNIFLDDVFIKTLADNFHSDSRVVQRWIRYGLPFIRKGNGRKAIDIEVFWKWAETHKEMIPFHKYERGSLPPEPKWLKDVLIRSYDNKKHRARITETEIQYVLSMHERGMTYAEIAESLGRTLHSVKWIARKEYNKRNKEGHSNVK